MTDEQLRLLRNARKEARGLARDLENAESAGMLVLSAKRIERMIGDAMAKEPVIPEVGHVRKQGGGIVYTLDEVRKKGV